MLPDVIDNHAVHLLLEGRFSDPFSLLGMHTLPQKGLRICAFFPDAKQVIAINQKDYQQTFTLINYKESGFFYQIMEDEFETFSYIYQVTWDNGYKQLMDDPYNFGTLLSEFDSYLLKEGTHLRPYQQLGSRNITLGGVDGSSFAVWAPNAKAVSVVGEFNFWEHRRNPMRFRQESGVWELFIPGKVNGNLYKYHIIDNQGISRFKADPYGVSYQLRPDTATQVANIPNPSHYRESSSKSPSFSKPVSIYEVHLGSWMRNESHQWLSYDELAERLIPYVKEMGFTHIELLPITEHPFDGSWGYQPTGIYAPTRRFGDPQAFKRFIDKAHQAELKVILDWVPAHFPKDESGLVRFDGTALYEYANPLEAEHQDWGTLIYNYKRYEVQNYLIGNALYWLECYELDGLRVDAVSSMIYRDYSRPQGQWIPNEYGGHQNLEAIDFLQKTNQVVNRECPGIMMIAEESTDFSGVTRPVDHGGLGFHYKWNMGWMHDTLRYMQLDPIYRQYHHQLMTFGLLYTYNENFVLPISHDEVVHGKGSLLNKMSGDTWQKFASLRAYFGFMWAYPGKKLLFMGSEFAQWNEWDHDSQLSWHLLKQAEHKGVQQLVKDLNHCYKKQLPLYQCDHSDCGFEWLVVDDFQNSVFVFVRKDNYGNEIIVVSNFTPVMRKDYRFGVNYSGRYRELINTDSSYYGGSNQGNHGSLIALSEPSHGKPYSLCLSLPPLSTLYLMKESADG